jgi:DNA invertase Pin-like site-specific DNA recombinase
MRKTQLEAEPGTKEAIGFVRVSKPDQANGFSPEAQADEEIEIAREMGYTLRRENIHFDLGFQGDDFDRPALLEGMEKLRTGQFKAAVFWSIDRMARDVRGGLEIVEQIRKLGADVIAGDLGLIKPDDDTLEVMMQMKLMYAQQEKKRIRSRVRLAIKKKLREQLIPNGKPGFGYRWEGQGWRIEAAEAAAVVQMFEWRAEGKSLLWIAARMKTGGWKRKWSAQSVSYILERSAYLGTFTYGRTRHVEPKTRRKPLSELHSKLTSRELQPKTNWHTIAIPAIITEDLFNRAQAGAKRIAQSGRGRPGTKTTFLLRGLLYCRCGARGRGKQKRRKSGLLHLRYGCTQAKGNIQSDLTIGRCTNVSVRAKELENTVWGAVVEAFTNVADLELRLKAFARLKSTAQPADMKQIKARSEALKRREQVARRKALDYLDEPETQAFYEAEAKKSASERRSLERQIETAIPKVGISMAMRDLWRLIGEKLANVTDEGKREVIELLVARITIDGLEAIIDLRIPSSAKVLTNHNSDGGSKYQITPQEFDNFYPLSLRRKIA